MIGLEAVFPQCFLCWMGLVESRIPARGTVILAGTCGFTGLASLWHPWRSGQTGGRIVWQKPRKIKDWSAFSTVAEIVWHLTGQRFKTGETHY